MIRVEYKVTNEKEMELTMQGHSDYAEPGKDIVCAAATILARTLAEDVDLHGKNASVDLRPGYACIRAKGDRAMEALRVVMTGFRLLEQNYPEQLRIG